MHRMDPMCAGLKVQAATVRSIVLDKSLSISQKRGALHPELSRLVEQLVLSSYTYPQSNSYDAFGITTIAGCVALAALAKVPQLLLDKEPEHAKACKALPNKTSFNTITKCWLNHLTLHAGKPHPPAINRRTFAFDAELFLIEELLSRLPPSAAPLRSLSLKDRARWAAQALCINTILTAIAGNNSKHLKTINLSLLHIPVKNVERKIADRVRTLYAGVLNEDLDYRNISPTIQLFGCVKSL